MKSSSYCSITFLLMAVLIAQSGTAAEKLLPGRVERTVVRNMADIKLGSLPMIEPSGRIAVLPYIGMGDTLGAFIALDRGTSIQIGVSDKVQINAVGTGCIDDERKTISFTAKAGEQDGVYLHRIDQKSSTHQRKKLLDGYSFIKDAAYNCQGVVVLTEGVDPRLEYFSIVGEETAKKPQWSISLKALSAASQPVSPQRMFVGRTSVEVVVALGSNREKWIYSISSKDGKVVRGVSYPTLSEDLVAVERTAYGYVGIVRKGAFSRSSTYLIIDPFLRKVGQISIDSLYPPMARTATENAYIFVEPTRAEGKPALRVMTATMNGITYLHDQVAINPELKGIVFGRAVLGYEEGKPFVVVLGTRLQKAEKGFELKDSVFRFPLIVETQQ